MLYRFYIELTIKSHKKRPSLSSEGRFLCHYPSLDRGTKMLRSQD